MTDCPKTGRNCLTLTAFEAIDMTGAPIPRIELLDDHEDYQVEKMISMGQSLCTDSECGVTALANVIAVRNLARQIAFNRNRKGLEEI